MATAALTLRLNAGARSPQNARSVEVACLGGRVDLRFRVEG